MHVLADLHGVAPHLLVDAGAQEAALRAAAAAAGAHVLSAHFHAFGSGQGITGVLLLAESHVSIHTWPEAGFAAIDIFMCGTAAPQRALFVLQAALQPASCDIHRIARGAGAAGAPQQSADAFSPAGAPS
jgi:S-adenosylmethionine decarboxylase